MSDIDVTAIDLAKGLKVKNLEVPEMMVEVVLKNPAKDLAKAIKDDKLIVQSLAMAAIEKLNDAKKEFQAAAEKLDEKYDKDRPETVKEAEERVKTFNTVCHQIADAQCKAATKAAENEWAKLVRKNKELTKYDASFAFRQALGAIAVAASTVHTILSFGATAPIAIATSAKTCLSMAADIYNHCRDIAKAEADIIETDEELEKLWTDDKLTAGKVGTELAAALGAPFVKSIKGLGTLLTEYDAKTAREGKNADKLYAEAKKLIKEIETTSKEAGPKMTKKLDELGKKADGLLDDVSKLSEAIGKSDVFSAAYRKRYDVYEAMEGKGLAGVAKATNIALLAAGLAATAKTIVDVAGKLA